MSYKGWQADNYSGGWWTLIAVWIAFPLLAILGGKMCDQPGERYENHQPTCIPDRTGPDC